MTKVNGHNVIKFQTVSPGMAIVMINDWNDITPFVVWTYNTITKEAFWGHYCETIEHANIIFESKTEKE